MKLPRSSFYHRGKRDSPDQMETDTGLRDRIEAICLEFPRYGYRRVSHQLRREAKVVNHTFVVAIIVYCHYRRR